MTNEPLSLERELSEFLEKDCYGVDVVAIAEKRFDEVLAGIVRAVSGCCERADRGKGRVSYNKSERFRAEIKRLIEEKPHLTRIQLIEKHGAHGDMITSLRRELVDEGKLIRTPNNQYRHSDWMPNGKLPSGKLNITPAIERCMEIIRLNPGLNDHIVGRRAGVSRETARKARIILTEEVYDEDR